MVAMDAKCGDLEMCDIMSGAQKTDDYAKINAYQQIPGMSDSATGVNLGESNAILRYLALQYAPALYPADDPVACAKIDMAIDNFTNIVYKKHVDVVYVVLGFREPPADQAAASTEYAAALEKWANIHLTGKCVNGDTLSIADYKVVPFIHPASQPKTKEKTGFELPPRIQTYLDDICAAAPSSAILNSAGGYSFAEFIATK